MEVKHLYKSLMLTTDGENGNQQDGQSDRDKDAYSSRLRVFTSLMSPL